MNYENIKADIEYIKNQTEEGANTAAIVGQTLLNILDYAKNEISNILSPQERLILTNYASDLANKADKSELENKADKASVPILIELKDYKVGDKLPTINAVFTYNGVPCDRCSVVERFGEGELIYTHVFRCVSIVDSYGIQQGVLYYIIDNDLILSDIINAFQGEVDDVIKRLFAEGLATAEHDGLMSHEDKIAIDNINSQNLAARLSKIEKFMADKLSYKP